MRRRVVRSALFSVSLLVVTGITLEIGVRLWGYSDRYIWEPVYMPFNGTDEIPLALLTLSQTTNAPGFLWEFACGIADEWRKRPPVTESRGDRTADPVR